MGWIAWFGMTVPVLLVANQAVQNILFSLSIYFSFWIIGFVGTSCICFESCRNLLRYQCRGWGRPRLYFELGRLIIGVLVLILAPLLTAGLFIPAAAKQTFFLFYVLRAFLAVLFALLFVVGVYGHLLSLATGRRVFGRAYECTTFFVTIFGGILLATWGYMMIPDQKPNIIDLLVGWGLFVLGLVMVAIGALSECNREAKRKQRRA